MYILFIMLKASVRVQLQMTIDTLPPWDMKRRILSIQKKAHPQHFLIGVRPLFVGIMFFISLPHLF